LGSVSGCMEGLGLRVLDFGVSVEGFRSRFQGFGSRGLGLGLGA